ncbi:MAG: hypothetical protein Q8880_04200 [Bacteroidota bacterium]|nr:hypothetical protein [Bacteroidota bacterium]
MTNLRFSRRITYIFSALLFSYFIFSCNNSNCNNNKGVKGEKKNNSITSVKDTINEKVIQSATDTSSYVNYYNDIARYIAGLPLNKSSKLYSLTLNKEWINYQKQSDSLWMKIGDKRLNKIHIWTNKEMKDVVEGTKTLFYPFGGPDFLFSNIFFPNAEKYVLIGLENVGVVPDVRGFEKNSLGYYLGDISKSIKDITQSSFFITNNMIKDLNKPDVRGTLPIIMLFVARTGNQILDIKSFEINSQGNIEYLKNHKSGKSGRYGKGVEITFRKANTNQKRYIYYFPVDLSNKGLTNNPNSRMFIEKLDSGMTTYVKSASYLMHSSTFSEIRHIILSKSKYMLQDDSGIPYKFFDQKVWDLKLYGNYIKPIKPFNWCNQEDLRNAFKTKANPLPFNIGYGKISNQFLLRKKG